MHGFNLAFDDGPAAVTAAPFASGDLFAPTSSYVLDVQLPGARDARSPVTIELRGDEVNRIGPNVFGPGAPIALSVEVLDGAARTVCFDAFALDAAGNQAALDEQLCVDLEPAAGCAQTSRSSTASIALVLAALALVRRRRA